MGDEVQSPRKTTSGKLGWWFAGALLVLLILALFAGIAQLNGWVLAIFGAIILFIIWRFFKPTKPATIKEAIEDVANLQYEMTHEPIDELTDALEVYPFSENAWLVHAEKTGPKLQPVTYFYRPSDRVTYGRVKMNYLRVVKELDKSKVSSAVVLDALRKAREKSSAEAQGYDTEDDPESDGGAT